jgi:phage shock protein E
MKRYHVFIAALVMELILVQAPCIPVHASTDMDGHWAAAYVEILVQKDIICGFPDGSFRLDSYMTLAQFIKIVVSVVSGIKQSLPASGTKWADVYMDEALRYGLIDDAVHKDKALWEKPVSRLDMTYIVHSALLNILNESDEGDITFVEKALTDLNSCHSCRPHIEQCYAKGIIVGRPNRTFGGDESMTRAEGCTVVVRMIDKTLRKIPEHVEEATDYMRITPADAKLKREKDPNVVFVDVRKPEENVTGYISGSINLTYGIATQADYELVLPDKSIPIIVYCASGIRSAKAAALLVSWGYLNVYDMGKVADYPDPLVVVDNKNN